MSADKNRARYRWAERGYRRPWRQILPPLPPSEVPAGVPAESRERWRQHDAINAASRAYGTALHSTRVAFAAWKARAAKADPRHAATGLEWLKSEPYAGPETGGAERLSIVWQLVELQPAHVAAYRHRMALREASPDDVAASRARRAAGLHTDSRRRYDWRPEHGHVVTVPVRSLRMQYRDVARLRASWYAWKRAQQDAGVWDLGEAAYWRLRLDTSKPGRIAATITDIRQQSADGTEPDRPADRVIEAVQTWPAGWPELPPRQEQPAALPEVLVRGSPASRHFDQIFDDMEAALNAGITQTVTVAADIGPDDTVRVLEVTERLEPAPPPAADDPTSPDDW